MRLWHFVTVGSYFILNITPCIFSSGQKESGSHCIYKTTNFASMKVLVIFALPYIQLEYINVKVLTLVLLDLSLVWRMSSKRNVVQSTT